MDDERWEPWSIRKRRLERAGQPTTYITDKVPKPVRAQTFYLLQSCAASLSPPVYFNGFWDSIAKQISFTHGLMHGLPSSRYLSEDKFAEYLGTPPSVDAFLDSVEITVRTALQWATEGPTKAEGQRNLASIGQTIDALNYHFGLRDFGFTYNLATQQFVPVESQYVHEHAVEPAIGQLHAAGWDGPLNEFMSAHKHYRRADYKASMNDALKAFESTMKAILDAHAWPYDPKAPAQKLITALFDNGFLPKPMQSYFGSIRSLLESGVPMMRNQMSGHGQGAKVTDVPQHLAAFALILSASNIVFLMEAHARYTDDSSGAK